MAGVAECTRHRVADREACAETSTETRSARRILCSITHRIGRLELRVPINVSDHSHRSALVHGSFHFGWQRDVLNYKFREIQAERLEILIHLLAQDSAELLIVRSEIERGNLRFSNCVTEPTDE